VGGVDVGGTKSVPPYFSLLCLLPFSFQQSKCSYQFVIPEISAPDNHIFVVDLYIFLPFQIWSDDLWFNLFSLMGLIKVFDFQFVQAFFLVRAEMIMQSISACQN
jgi:hypothetical protein